MNNIFFLTLSIDSSSPLLKLIYWLGLVACMAGGYKKGRPYYRIPLLHFILNSFAGGVIRDSFILHTKIWLLTADAIRDIIFVTVTGILYSTANEKISNPSIIRLNNYIISFWDAISLGDFVAIGVDKAFSLGYDNNIAIISGYFTACWGGVLANYLNPFVIFNVSTIYYHLITFIGCIIYCHYPNGCFICIFISVGLLIREINYSAIASYKHATNKVLFSSFQISKDISHFSDHLYNNLKYQTANQPNFHNILNYQQLFITLHRIRLC